MKLYYSKGACSLATKIFLQEAGKDCDFEAVDLRAKKTESGKDFLAINPKGAVPTLVLDDGQVLTENIAFLQYLADFFKAEKLLPSSGLTRYRVLEWLSFISSDMHKSIGALFNSTLDDQYKEKFVYPIIKRKLDYLNQHLLTNKYLLGDQFSLADPYLYVVLSWLPKFKFDTTAWPNVERYVKDVSQRESVQAAYESEGLATAV